MNEWTEYAPAGGWDHFTHSDALTASLWERLPVDAWGYLNFAKGSSAWESLADASLVSVEYEGERIVRLVVQGGDAGEFVTALAAEFDLAEIAA